MHFRGEHLDVSQRLFFRLWRSARKNVTWRTRVPNRPPLMQMRKCSRGDPTESDHFSLLMRGHNWPSRHRMRKCLLFAHMGWWSTALWTARTTWTRRLGRSLTLWCITLVGILVNYRVSQKNCFCQNWPWQIFLLMIRNPLSFFMTNAGNSFCNSYIDYLPGLHI